MSRQLSLAEALVNDRLGSNAKLSRIDALIDWSRTTEVREVRKDGSRLIYTTKPQPFSSYGKISVITLVWEKMK